MADYPISKEALQGILADMRNSLGNRYTRIGVDLALLKLDGFPQMDAVQVVRCRECKYRHSSEFCECRPEDAFCSDGAKMDTKEE